ncbi:MAG: rod shape-determining protein MreD [Acidobacteriota bacterium]
MTSFLRFALALVGAAALHVATHWAMPSVASWIGPFLILSASVGLRATPAMAALGGSVAGLAHDALTGGPFGLFGFADTAVAYLVARVEQRVVVQQALQVALLFALAAALEGALVALVQFAVVASDQLPSPVASAARVATTALAGAALFTLGGRLRAAESERRERRRRRLRLPEQR